jgi:hypothetical protein
MSKYRGKVTPASPRIRTRTEEQSARERAAQADLQTVASRCAARWTMKNHHGCTGKNCASPRHPVDREWMHAALMALGVISDPQAQWAVGLGYKSSTRRKAVSG